MSSRMIPHYATDFNKLTLHDQCAVIKYGRLATKLEKQMARRRRYLEWKKGK